MKLVPVGARIPEDEYTKLRWLAYVRNTTVSALIASYVETGLAGEDLSRFVPPDQQQRFRCHGCGMVITEAEVDHHKAIHGLVTNLGE